jgi:hypothetical protein
MGIAKYESKSAKLAPMHVFYRRLVTSTTIALFVLLICLVMGTVGYHFIAKVAWIDSFHNASMILSGMGPVVEIKNTAGKIFSSLYAIFSGVVFITNIGIVLAPAAHRILHRLHVDESAGKSQQND